jgi:hypothetical protein
LLKILWEEDGIDPERTKPREMSGLSEYSSFSMVLFTDSDSEASQIDLLLGLRNSIWRRPDFCPSDRCWNYRDSRFTIVAGLFLLGIQNSTIAFSGA